jgi:3'-phosphoadenosine 5'-phosphosulfate (PAPS) 3'-phosphatase
LRVLASRSHGAPRLDAWLRGLDLPHRIDNAGSSLKFCRLAQGLADVYPRFGPTSQWDTAAGQCVLECAGGSVFDWGGRPLAYSLTEPWLNPEFVALGCTPGLALHARLFPRAPTSRPIGSP